MKLHRHIGGLEMKGANLRGADMLHRHIGGLENGAKILLGLYQLHRHIGGLEIPCLSIHDWPHG